MCGRSGAAATVNIFSFAVSIGKPSPSSMSMAPATEEGAASATPFREGVVGVTLEISIAKTGITGYSGDIVP